VGRKSGKAGDGVPSVWGESESLPGWGGLPGGVMPAEAEVWWAGGPRDLPALAPAALALLVPQVRLLL